MSDGIRRNGERCDSRPVSPCWGKHTPNSNGVCAISKMIWFPGKSMLIAKLAAGASKLVELEMQLAVVLGTARTKELAGSLRLLSSPVQRTGASPR